MTLNSAHKLPPVAMQPSRKPRVILIFLIALCGLFVMSYATRLSQKSALETQISLMQAKIDAAMQEQAELKEEQAKLDQPDYIDGIARKWFDSALPGDKMLVILDEQARNSKPEQSAAVAAANPIDYRNFPVWQQWIVFFTTDSFSLSMK